ncbi:MAG: hypothetical protein KDJ65_18230 [Anaerolineae bacterium]|nr:hypothetical protein [Anaerolineae bacterium]
MKTLSYGGHQFYRHNEYSYFIKFPTLFKKNAATRFLYPLLVLPFYLPLIFKFDTFIFVWSITFLPLNLDLFLLRWLGKRVIIFNCGSEVRYRPIHYRIDTEVLSLPRFKDKAFEATFIKSSLSFLRTFYTQKVQEWSGCQIVSLRDQATFQKKDYFIFQLATQKVVDGPKKTNAVPLIIHAPSNRAIKGTEYVLAAIDMLKQEGLEFDFELIEGQDNAYVLSRLAAADIAVDEPGVWIAKFSSEALAASCVVIGGNNPRYMGFARTDSPVIQFRPDTEYLARTLRRLILDQPERQAVMQASYAYWQNNYSPEAFVSYFEKLLIGQGETFAALPSHKKMLLKFAPKEYQKRLIWLFY